MSSVQEDGLISQAVYENPDADSARKQLEELGWKSLGKSSDYLSKIELETAKSNGFHGEAFQSPSGEIVIGFRGTEFGLGGASIKDYWADMQLIIATDPGQKDSAIAFTQAVLGRVSATEIHFTGHSLGGYLAQESKYWLDTLGQLTKDFSGVASTGVGFNNPGMGRVVDDMTDNAFMNIHDTGDIINYVGFEHLGQTIRVDAWRYCAMHNSHMRRYVNNELLYG